MSQRYNLLQFCCHFSFGNRCVVTYLQAQPPTIRQAEEAAEAKVRVCGNSALA